MNHSKVVLATNNGEIGGGEVMLLAIARELRELSIQVQVVGPRKPSGLVDASRVAGFSTIILPASDRRTYMCALRRWRRSNSAGLLWCNGLVPSVATSLTRNRLVHLHQDARGLHALLARVARIGARAVLVPSIDMSRRLHGTYVLENWVDKVPRKITGTGGDVIRLGFIGRLSTDKGVHILAAALHRLDQEQPGRYRLLLAGEPRFVRDKSYRLVEQALGSVGHLVDSPGWMSRSDFFSVTDLMICPSVWAEPFGLVVAEAMSARMPFIISDAGALPEVAGLSHPWVAKAGDVESLADVIRRAANEDASAAISNAYERWNAHYSPAAGRSRLRALLEQFAVMEPRESE